MRTTSCWVRRRQDVLLLMWLCPFRVLRGAFFKTHVVFSEGQASACTSTPKGVLPLSEGAMTKSSRGVLRRRSWRTHYVRPSKALDESTPGRNEDESSRSVPLHRCYVASVQSVSMPCSRQVSGGAIALSHAESSPSSQTVTNSIPGMDEGDAKKSSTQAKFVHF
ncbi:unnamed protein product [Toxocara canis]|uniref:Secreted protein n=1 Tax=Toxocara canis TaxID=6265 RepID=A0A183UXS7_TOXCA|nr:unnamed protein product [Toxocara canis]